MNDKVRKTNYRMTFSKKSFLSLSHHFGCRLMRLPESDAVAIGIEAAFRNTSLAVLIKASVFPAIPGIPDPFADQVLFVAFLSGGVAFWVVLPPLMRHRRSVPNAAAD